IGFAPKLSVTVCHANTARGIRPAIKTPSLRSRCRLTICITTVSPLEVLLQVHPGIEMGHLVSIAIKQQGLALREFPKAAFTRLAPAWVWHVWIHVRIEAVLAGAAAIQVVTGCSSTKRILTMDLTLLKPYFHGTTSRSGAPFWLG